MPAQSKIRGKLQSCFSDFKFTIQVYEGQLGINMRSRLRGMRRRPVLSHVF